MDRIEELKAKYQNALIAIVQKESRWSIFISGTTNSSCKARPRIGTSRTIIWNQIKAVDPSYSDLTCDLRIDGSLPQPSSAQDYEVKPGDSLWKIAQSFYGNGNLFRKIIEANPGKLRDADSVIHPGDVLKIPAA